jgi:hypothetical protein
MGARSNLSGATKRPQAGDAVLHATPIGTAPILPINASRPWAAWPSTAIDRFAAAVELPLGGILARHAVSTRNLHRPFDRIDRLRRLIMRIAITGGTGFVGRYILRELAPGNTLRAWFRTPASRAGLDDLPVEWVHG